jgi:hypothetical protein
MRPSPTRAAAALAIALAILAPHAADASADKADPGSCNITSGGIGSGHNTVTCNFGLTDAPLKQATKAAVEGATEALQDHIDKIRETLGVTTARPRRC